MSVSNPEVMVLVGEEVADPELTEMLEKACTKVDYEKVMNEAKRQDDEECQGRG